MIHSLIGQKESSRPGTRRESHAGSTQYDAGNNWGVPINGDATVGILDLLTLLANWGPCL